jgi:hypothetical protein
MNNAAVQYTEGDSHEFTPRNLETEEQNNIAVQARVVGEAQQLKLNTSQDYQNWISKIIGSYENGVDLVNTNTGLPADQLSVLNSNKLVTKWLLPWVNMANIDWPHLFQQNFTTFVGSIAIDFNLEQVYNNIVILTPRIF